MAIESILNRTFTDWEMIAIDNASQDTTLEILENYANRANRIKVYSNTQNIGPSGSLNRALGLACGEYIVIQEHDDISLPHPLAAEVQVLDSMPEVAVASGKVERVDKSQEHIRYYPDILVRSEQYPQAHMVLSEAIIIWHRTESDLCGG
jgi:glycosyltransferase EpsE